MRWPFTILLVLGIPMYSAAQGARYEGRTQTKNENQTSSIPNAKVTVCLQGASGVPCSPITNIYSDKELRHLMSNPLIASVDGSFSFWAPPGRTYIITVGGPRNRSYSFSWRVPSFVGGSSYSAPGTFNNLQMNEYAKSYLNGCSPTMEFHALSNNFLSSTDGITGCVAVPQDADVYNANVFAGYGNNSSTVTNAVGVWGSMRCIVSKSSCWGADYNVIDSPGKSAASLVGVEIDMGVGGSPERADGIVITGNMSGRLPPSARAIWITPVSGRWPAGIYIEEGAAQDGIYLGAQRLGSGEPSTPITFHAKSKTGAELFGHLQLDADGNVLVTPGPNGSVISGGAVDAATGISVGKGDLMLNRDDRPTAYILRPNKPGSKNLGFAVAEGGPLDSFTVETKAAIINGKLQSLSYGTATNCASSTSPASCGTAAAGSVIVPLSASSVGVQTTAVTADSEIMVTFDPSLSAKLGVKCNKNFAQAYVSARVPGQGFTIATTVAVKGPSCYSYYVIN